uniref:BG0 n=2 Tax=Gallus gallus TaxID=9031 RepID=A0A023PS16_CHICK|nr:BG0 protein precursor [Gallus gallus]AOR50936.1 BG0 [Gallus gallus]AOR50937.1 BG0 [Gallus gallus]AOR50938.1 BG0 [Gallus gallus]
MWFVSGCKQSSFALPWRTLLAYLVALNLLCPGSAKLRVVALNFPVTATVGQDVVLHCHLSPCKDARSLDIRWIQHRSSGLVHHYQNGEDLEQMEEYKGRTELLRDGLSDGNLYLHITAVSSSDSGSYMCTVQDDGGYVEAMVNLQVSDPFSHIVHPWKVALAVVLTLLFASFVIIVFLHRKQAAQTKNLKIKDAVLEELPVILVKKIEEFEKENSQLKKQVAELVEQIEEFEKENSQLKKQVAELVEQIEEFEKENSQLKEHYMKMVLSAADLKKQVAELELGESSPNQRNMGFPTG